MVRFASRAREPGAKLAQSMSHSRANLIHIGGDLQAVTADCAVLPEASHDLFPTFRDAPFLSRDWFELFLRTCVDRGTDPIFIPVRKGDVSGVWPLSLHRHSKLGLGFDSIESLTNFYSLSYGPIAGCSSLLDTLGELGDAAATRLWSMNPAWVDLQPLVQGQADWEGLERSFSRAGYVTRLQQISSNWVLRRGDLDFETFLRQRPAHIRNTYCRKLRRLHKTHTIAFRHFRSEADDLDEADALYHSVYARSWKRPEPYPDFIPGLIRLIGRHDALDLGVLEVDGKAIAAQIWIRTPASSVMYKLAHDDAFASFSPGLVLMVEMLRMAIDVDRSPLIDFGLGADPYKREWMAECRQVSRLLAIDPRHPMGALRLAKHRYIGHEGRSLVRTTVRNRSRHDLRPGGATGESSPPSPGETAGAVVVGACGHGLAITRALSKAGVDVAVIEADHSLPGVLSRYGKVRWASKISGPGLLRALFEFPRQEAACKRPVLFLTNDTMVRELAQHWPKLQDRFALSWGECTTTVTRLLEKSSLEQRCVEVGLNYPRTVVISSLRDVDTAIETIGFPMILKPSRPLSRFKTHLPASAADLATFTAAHSADLPFIAQTWIAGDDRAIYFVAFYLDHGRTLAQFVGHKIRSRPMGHTTIAEPAEGLDLVQTAERFFEGLGLSGPVSLELKRDPEGRLWVIEPTVGRTDFWVDVCISNGVDLPMIEFSHQTGRVPPPSAPRRPAVWFNEERDPLGLAWYLFVHRGPVRRRRPIFLFCRPSDPLPLLDFAWRRLLSVGARAWARLVNTFRLGLARQ